MPTVLRDALSRKDSLLRLRADDTQSSNNYLSTSPSASDSEQKPRQKPSPGLAVRLKALGFGKDSTKATTTLLSSQDQVGRIPEDRIDKLIRRSRSTSTLNVQSDRRGRGWSNKKGTSNEITGDTEGGTIRSSSSVARFGEKEMTTNAGDLEMDSQKYRLPEHTNGNGTKAMADTKIAHFERSIPLEDTESPPPALPKDTPPDSTSGEFDPSSYFNPLGLQRSGSIYTLSRVSFANQLAQLTSLHLPDADSVSTKVSAIPTSKTASRALMGAAEQIRSWISKASEVISGLDGEDDVEWAAAGGREGLEEVDNAITRFEELITVYVTAIESLQKRPDVASVQSEELKFVVLQVETILSEWEKIKKKLKSIKNSLEIAMEWEELWNTVLGDIGNEMDDLSRLVFEMEERRHKSLAEAGSDGVDINELENIVDDTPPAKTRLQSSRFSMPPPFPMSPNSPNTPPMSQDDSSLLALFARMQPLRASLDFLPMRLSTFHTRAEAIFPTACEELETRQTGLEKSWKSLEKDAESLRRELGEDRWILVFRGAGRQAQKMYDSVERSLSKLKESIDTGLPLQNPAMMGKKVENYEAKKTHYGPAIERVLSIIEKGVKDRLTVNGEILRQHSEMQRKWDKLKEQMNDLDTVLEDLQADKKNQQLRDSISSLVSNDRSTLGSFNGTPGSSPASSVVMTVLDPTTPANKNKPRSASKSGLPQPANRRNVSSGSKLPRASLTSRLSSSGVSTGGTPSPTSRQSTATPTGLPRPGVPSAENRPRWNSSVNTKDIIIGHNFKPLSLSTPSPYRRVPVSERLPQSTHSNRSSQAGLDSKIPLLSPPSDYSSSRIQDSTPSRTSVSRLAFRNKLSTPGPYSQQNLRNSSAPMRPSLASKTSMSALNNNRRSSFQTKTSDSTGNSPLAPKAAPRPASSLTATRRTSLLPQPKGRADSSVTGRESPQAIAGANAAMRRNSSQTSANSKEKDRRAWR